MPITVNLGKRYERLADYLITIGRFENRSEVLRHAMRLLEEDEYRRKYIHRDKDFTALLPVYSRLHYMQREKDYPSDKSRRTEDGGFSSEVLENSAKFVDQQLEKHAVNNDGAPRARDDGRGTGGTPP